MSLTAVYFAVAGLGLQFAFVHGTVSPVWPPTGLAIAALTLWGLRFFPAIAVGAFAANCLLVDNPLPVAAGIAVGSTLEAVLGAWMLRRLGVRGEVTRVRDAVAILAVAVLAPLPSATGGVLSLTLGGFSAWDRYPSVWLVWWLGDFMGALIVLPLLLAWFGERSPVNYPHRPVEFVGTLTVAMALLSFQHLNTDALAMLGVPFLPPSVFLLPPVLWAVLRLRPRQTMLVLAAASALVVAYTGVGNADAPVGPLLSQQMALFVVGGSSLLLLGALAERDRAQQAVRDSERRLELAVDIAQLGAWEWNPASQELYWSPLFKQQLGYADHELPSRIEEWASRLHPDDRERVLAYMTGQTAPPGRIEYRMRHRDGSDRWFLARAVPVSSPDGKAVNLVGTQLDISEQKLVEQMRAAARIEFERQARRVAEATSLAKSEFLASMSHELRSPLNTILGFARLIAQDRELPARVREDLTLILKSGEHLYALVNQVLDLSKLDAGRATCNPVDFDLRLLLEDLRSLFEPVAASKNLQLIVAWGDGVPRYVRSDALKLRQVLINLIDNALKFSRQDDVRIAVDLVKSGEDGRTARLRFSVADRGPGIAPGEIDQLFDAFAQGDAGRRAQRGSGLGLAISRGFVRLMGGDMRIESKVGQGTVVRFDLPVEIATGAPAPAAAPFRQVGSLAPGQPRYRILVVDDRTEARELLVRLLAPLGFEVQEAAHGEAAIAAWRRWRPHLIWMDLAMPGIDGFEATRRIRAALGGQRTVIVALTARGGDGDREAALAAGCDEVLFKPFRDADLFALLEKYLKVRFIDLEPAPALPPSLTAEALATLPEEARRTLEAALLQLDIDAVERAIDAIRGLDARIADALAASAGEFQFDAILSTLHHCAVRARPS